MGRVCDSKACEGATGRIFDSTTTPFRTMPVKRLLLTPLATRHHPYEKLLDGSGAGGLKRPAGGVGYLATRDEDGKRSGSFPLPPILSFLSSITDARPPTALWVGENKSVLVGRDVTTWSVFRVSSLACPSESRAHDGIADCSCLCPWVETVSTSSRTRPSRRTTCASTCASSSSQGLAQSGTEQMIRGRGLYAQDQDRPERSSRLRRGPFLFRPVFSLSDGPLSLSQRS